ncbi:YeeE/YedE family protein [Puniceibacterium confluentis]|uniref:YeeE/YedE family protein n=1 Tax=Puniceibacterium confluentis TaxID=1958944 RepID=UPI0011B606FA|nr:YeeE/YedE family protein [Puniceibacterium confluentis]
MLGMTYEHLAVAGVGLFGGLLLGLAARLGRFCSLGAIEDMLYGGSTVRMRLWGVAIGVAVLGSFGLIAAGWLDVSTTPYLGARWQPLASVFGGVMFGYGMALAGNCGFGALARLGGGDLRSFVIVLVMGVTAYTVLSGPVAPLRHALFPQVATTGEVPPGLAHLIGVGTGLPAAWIGMALGLMILAAALASRPLWQKPHQVVWAALVGVAVISGWLGTAHIGATGFEALPVTSHSFAAPVGETILWFMSGSARPLSFAVGSVAGVWTGAFLGSLYKGHFRWEACEDPRELRRQIFGAVLMGTGAVIAMGCTVGQGLSAFSLLAYSAPVTSAAIFAGAAIGLRQLIEGFQPAA